MPMTTPIARPGSPKGRPVSRSSMTQIPAHDLDAAERGSPPTYTWDAASQLTAISYAVGSTNLGNLTWLRPRWPYQHPRRGSLFQSILPAAVTSATYDAANRLTKRVAAGVTAAPSWDANGNLNSDGLRTYTWDARNRLTGIVGLALSSMTAPAARQTATVSGKATSFLYDFWDVAEEQQSGKASADLLPGLNVDERFSRAGSTYLVDALGLSVALAATSGTTVAVQTNYGYDPYGATQTTGTASTNSFQCTGRENDQTGLYHYRARYYNPTWGRFISEDPIGLGGGDVNLYRYAGNDPVDLNDPSGNCPWCLVIPIVAGGAAYFGSRGLLGCLADGSCLPPSRPAPPPPGPMPAVPPAPGQPAPANPCRRRQTRMLRVPRQAISRFRTRAPPRMLAARIRVPVIRMHKVRNSKL
jgi:RHS repeat-associated protein